MPPAHDSTVARITGIAPQLLVVDLGRAVAYYRERLGFTLDFTYEAFYASVSRDGFAIHLKHVDALPADRDARRREEHLDAYIAVSGVRALFAELKQRGAHVIQPLEERPWNCVDFHVADADGYVLCFSELASSATTSSSS